MRRYKYVNNIKASLFIFGIILIILFLSYTRILINELRHDNTKSNNHAQRDRKRRIEAKKLQRQFE